MADSGTWPVVEAARGQVDRRQRLQRGLQRRVGLQDHAVLVGLGEDGGDDALAEHIVQRVVDRRRRDAEARRGGAVDHQVDRQPLLLQVAGDIGQLGQLAAAAPAVSAPRSVNAARLGSSSTNWYCVRLTVASMVRSCTGCRYSDTPATVGGFLLQAADDVGGVQAALVLRLQVDQEAAAVQRGVAAVHADEGRQAVHVRVLQDGRGQRLLVLAPWRRRTWSAPPRKCPGSRRCPAPGKTLSGMMTYSQTVSASVASAISSVSAWWSSTQSSAAVVAADHPVEAAFRREVEAAALARPGGGAAAGRTSSAPGSATPRPRSRWSPPA